MRLGKALCTFLHASAQALGAMRTFAFIATLLFSIVVMAEDLHEWLNANEPIVERYLLILDHTDLGHRLSGVTLTDGTQPLKGYVFLADLSEPERGLHDFKFRATYAGIIYESHYLWLDAGFPKIYLPSYLRCPGKFIEPGGIAVLSGDQYTYTDLDPGGQLVVTMCDLHASPNNAFQPMLNLPRFGGHQSQTTKEVSDAKEQSAP